MGFLAQSQVRISGKYLIILFFYLYTFFLFIIELLSSLSVSFSYKEKGLKSKIIKGVPSISSSIRSVGFSSIKICRFVWEIAEAWLYTENKGNLWLTFSHRPIGTF